MMISLTLAICIHMYCMYIIYTYMRTHKHTQTAGVNSTDPPSSGAGNVHGPTLMSQVRRVHVQGLFK